MKRLIPYGVLLAAWALGALSCQALYGRSGKSAGAALFAATLAPAAPGEALVALYKKANPGVVAIRTLSDDGGGLGSGFVYDQAGRILTNYHVVEEETDFEIAFASGFKTRGWVLGRDLDSDLAVLQVDAPVEELHPLSLGDSDQMQVGDPVAAIGNPFGFEGTMTVGIVSGIGRTLRSMHITEEGSNFTAGDIIQTDAAINPGNSGGPLLNMAGEVIGINESIISGGGDRANSGVGFAVSARTISRVVQALITAGKYPYPYLGIFSSTSDLGILEQEALKLPQTSGVYITYLNPEGPAARAGLRAGEEPSSIPGLRAGGDLITAVDGQPVMDLNDLISYVVKNKSVGDPIELTVLRDGQELRISLVLGERPK